MEVLNARYGGLDVHKNTVVGCVRVARGGRVEKEVRTLLLRHPLEAVICPLSRFSREWLYGKSNRAGIGNVIFSASFRVLAARRRAHELRLASSRVRQEAFGDSV